MLNATTAEISSHAVAVRLVAPGACVLEGLRRHADRTSAFEAVKGTTAVSSIHSKQGLGPRRLRNIAADSACTFALARMLMCTPQRCSCSCAHATHHTHSHARTCIRILLHAPPFQADNIWRRLQSGSLCWQQHRVCWAVPLPSGQPPQLGSCCESANARDESLSGEAETHFGGLCGGAARQHAPRPNFKRLSLGKKPHPRSAMPHHFPQVQCVAPPAARLGAYPVTVVVDSGPTATSCCFTYDKEYTPSEEGGRAQLAGGSVGCKLHNGIGGTPCS
jgi:hypothetical protein